MTWGNGDGKQVINLQESSRNPVRLGWVADSDEPPTFTYTRAVAYDIPDDKFEIFIAWDSPFDFLWKMNEQRKAIFKHYSSVVEEAPESESVDNETAVIPTGNGSTITITGVTNNTLSSWNTTTAPSNQWGFYTDNTKTTPIFTFTAKKSAGTDCLGFVSRTASYDGNIYPWPDTEADLAEKI